MTTQSQITQILRFISTESRPDLADGRLRFLPRKALFDFISAHVVLEFLQSRSEFPDQQQSDFAELADSISPADDCRRCTGPHCTGGRIIFAALLSLPRPELISVIFQNPDKAICDASLNQESWPTEGVNDLPEALRDTLPPDELERFLHFTWQMRSPFLQDLASQDSEVVEHEILEYPENASLPWTVLEGQRAPIEDDTEDTERTTIQRIVIHPAHYEAGTLDGPLALKISDDYQAERKYILEVAANLRTPTHERIVPLLSAFKHRGKFHLILPWASGGNLADLIQKYYTPGTKALDGQLAADWYSEEWLLAQCLGLAEGLDAVHQRSLLRQIHADIKPENILCFTPSDKSSGPFTLKLADFGEAKEVNSDDGTILVKHVPHTKTYRPPEHDTDEVLSLNYDVWCLGCVFLEFITWAIAGSESKESFEDARLNERDDRKASTAKGTVLQDTFFKKASASWRPRILPQIRVEHNSTTIEAGGLPKKVYRRQHRWSLEYAGSTRVRTLRKKAVQKQITLLKEKCIGTRLHAFLEIIDSSMLVVDPKKRAQSSTVLTLLNNL